MPYELFIALRYAFIKRKNRFISFISLVSILGMMLGVMALIVVLSVMNGFQQELRSKMLGVVSHVQVSGYNNTVRDWEALVERIMSLPAGKRVVSAAPYIMGQGMISNRDYVQGAIIRGILPAEERKISEFDSYMVSGKLDSLQPGQYNIILGIELAKIIGVRVGDSVTVIAPQGTVTPAGILPRLRQFQVSGIFKASMYEFDQGMAMIHMSDAQKLYRMEDLVNGVRLKLDDLMMAPVLAKDLQDQLKGFYFVTDWTKMNEPFFRAIQMEKRVMLIILTLIVAVAAFNIVSTLVMTVTDKRSDIAILQTLGATQASIRRIFMLLGMITGVMGILLGVIFGVLIAINVDVIVPAIERFFGVQFLEESVYAITEVPSVLLASDVLLIVGISFVLSLFSTLLPSWQASRIRPAEALRYE